MDQKARVTVFTLEQQESKQARQDVSEVIWSLENLRPWKKSRKGLRL